MGFRLPAFSPVAWLTAERLVQQVMWLGLFVVLAPILGPQPYGQFSIVMVFVGICELLLLEGATEALVSVKELDSLHSSTVNASNLLLALVATAVMAAFAPLLAAFYQDPELKRLLWALCPLPILSSLTSTPLAVLRRSLLYRQMAIRSILGLTIGGVFGIVLALMGAGAWALALQVLAQRATEFIVLSIAVPKHNGFKWSRPHFNELRPVAQDVVMARAMSVIGGQLPRLIIGYVLGSATLGLFTLATRFLEISVQISIVPRTSIGRVNLRHFAPGSPAFEVTFVEMLQDACLLLFPLLMGAIALTPLLFRVWLDQRWQDAILPTQLILLSGMPLVLSYSGDSTFLGANQSTLFARTTTIQSLTICAVTLAAVPFGLDITCLALAIRAWLLMPMPVYLLWKKCHLRVRDIFIPIARALVASLLMAALVAVAAHFLHVKALRPAITLGSLVVWGVLVYFGYLYLFSRRQMKSLFGSIFLLYRSPRLQTTSDPASDT